MTAAARWTLAVVALGMAACTPSDAAVEHAGTVGSAPAGGTQSADPNVDSESGPALTEDVEPASLDPADAPPTTDAAGSLDPAFFCGEFGSERPPVVIRLDMGASIPSWRHCGLSGVLQFFGRADGATLLSRQDRGCSSIVSIDDQGDVRLRHVADDQFRQVFVGGRAVIFTDAEVSALDAVTGEMLWQHPIARGTPIGATSRVVVETVTDASADEGITVRGVDEFRGTELWIQQVPAAPSPVLSGWTPTVGAGVVAVPHDSTGQSTTILDANTGDVIDVVNGEVIALGDALVQRDPGDPNPVALVDPRSGERVTIADGAPVWVRGLDPGLTAASGVLMASDTTTGPAAKLWLVDLPSGTVRWTVDYRPPIARDDRTVLVTDGDELVALDAADGTDRWRYRPPDEQLRFVAASVAGDVVVALPALADPLADVLDDEAATNDCGADPVADSATSCTNRLDALVAATAPAVGRLTVAESDDGQRFCVAAEPEPVLGDVPAMSTTAPRLETPLFGMMSDDGKPDGVYYVFAVPAGFDSNVRVLDEDGEAMPSAVGPSGNYLVVFQAVVGMIGGGFASTQRTVQLVAVNGTPLGTIDFDGFGTQSGSDMSDFDACLQRNGVVRELPQPGSTSRPTPDVATSVLLRAWTACEDHFFSYLRAAQGFTEEFTANLRAETDCLAEAGWFQHLGFEVDMLAWAAASTDCQRETPAYAALVTCLGHEGLDVSADELPGGSYPLPLAAQAWVVCRDTYARWRDDGSEAFAAVLVDFDCTAQQGWIIPLLDSVERAGAEADRVQRSC